MLGLSACPGSSSSPLTLTLTLTLILTLSAFGFTAAVVPVARMHIGWILYALLLAPKHILTRQVFLRSLCAPIRRPQLYVVLLCW